MTPATLRASLAVTMSVAGDPSIHHSVRLAIVLRRLSSLIDQVPDEFTTAGSPGIARVPRS